jgi:uncharacterized repeat protein (TIGR03837 family)
MITVPNRWDIFARVVDNFGDAGVSWRLARQLAVEHGRDVVLWLDQLAPLARIAPDVVGDRSTQRAHGVTIRHWTDPFPAAEPADVVVEAFGCGLPDAYVRGDGGTRVATAMVRSRVSERGSLGG